MKNIVKIIIFTIFINAFAICTFSATWISVPSINSWLYMKDNGLIAKNEWVLYDGDNDGINEYYYFSNNGIMLKNTTTPDGKQVNSDGLMVVNGVIQKENNNVINNTINQTDINSSNNSGGSQVIVANDNTSSSYELKRELKNNIAKKSGVEFVDTKKIDGKNWANLIRFNGNDSYLKSNCGNFNELSFEAGIVDRSDNGMYLLTIYVNNQILAEYDDEYFNSGEKIVCNFDPNSEIMIVYSATSEEGMYLSSDSKYLYLKNAVYNLKNN